MCRHRFAVFSQVPQAHFVGLMQERGSLPYAHNPILASWPHEGYPPVLDTWTIATVRQYGSHTKTEFLGRFPVNCAQQLQGLPRLLPGTLVASTVRQRESVQCSLCFRSRACRPRSSFSRICSIVTLLSIEWRGTFFDSPGAPGTICFRTTSSKSTTPAPRYA